MSPIMILPARNNDPDPYYTHITTVGPTPIYYWALRETSGAVAAEENVGGNMDGVYTAPIFSQPSLTPSATTLAVGFNGSTSNVNSLGALPTYNEFNFIHQTGIFTISCWLQLSTLAGEKGIMASTAASNDVGFWFEYINGVAGRTNALRFAMARNIGGNLGVDAFQDSAITDLNAHHIAVKGDGTNVWFYVDGSEFMAVNTFAGFFGGDANRTPNIGRFNYTAPILYLDGVIEDVAVWNSTLSAGQILAQYNAG